MGVAIVIIVVAVAAIGIALLVRRRQAGAPEAVASPRPARPEPEPMHGLEDALNQVTDRSGTTMAARLDAEESHIAELRVSDDTGPLLRRALDHVTPHDEPASDEPASEERGDQAGGTTT